MKQTLFKEVSYSLSKLIEDIEMGEIGLPDIQRPFVWTPTKVRDLFDSMYKGFPVGYLLFWANTLAEGSRQIGTDSKQKVPRLLIVDGQQRLTSLYSVLKGKPVMTEDFKPFSINIAFRPRDESFEVTDAAVRIDPEFIPDISQLWAGHTSRNRFVKDFIAHLKENHPLTEEEEDDITEKIDALYDLQNYPFTAMELSYNVNEEQVADIFVRINSKGVTLKQADFILTLMSVFWDKGRADLEQFCQDSRKPTTNTSSSFNYFIEPDPDQLLRVGIGLGFKRARLQHVYSLLRGKDLDTGQFSDERRIAQFNALKDAQDLVLNLQNWHEFLKVLIRAGYRSNVMITSQMALIYAYTMYLIGKDNFKVEPFELRDSIARWYFMTSLTGRYTNSPEGAMEADLARLRNVKDAHAFCDVLNQIINDTFTDDYWNITLPNDLATSSARSPSLFAYYSALNLLDAKVLFSKMKVSELLDPAIKAKKSSTERHHLFPKNYLKTIGISDTKEINQIANFALVEWSDNIAITDTAPAEYLPKYIKRFTEPEINLMNYWHALPKNWEHLEYPVFLEQRRKIMAKVIRDGFAELSKRNAN